MKKTKNDRPPWLKTMAEFISCLKSMQTQRDRSEKLLAKLEQDFTTEASTYADLPHDRQLMLKVGLALMPMESPENIIEMAMRLTAAEQQPKPVQATAAKQQQTTPQKPVQRTAAKPEAAA